MGGIGISPVAYSNGNSSRLQSFGTQVPFSAAEQKVDPEHSVMSLCVEGSRWLLEAEQLTPTGTAPDLTRQGSTHGKNKIKIVWTMKTVTL